MSIVIRDYSDPDMKQILQLYNSVGWTNYTNNPSMLEAAIAHSLRVVAAFFEDRLIGLVRIVGDGYSVIYIQDIIVSPEHQRNGIGKLLVQEVDTLYPHVYQKVLLTDNQPRSLHFYEGCGFSLSSNFQCVAFVKFTS